MAPRIAELPLVLPAGGACESCVERLRAALTGMSGISGLEVDGRRSQLTIGYDDDVVALSRLQALVEDTGADLERNIKHATLSLTGLDCGDCARIIEQSVGRLPGILNVTANVAGSKMNVEYLAGAADRDQIVRVVRELGYGVMDDEAAYPAAAAGGQLTFNITGMDCADCARTIEQQVSHISGVRSASVNFMASRLVVDADRRGMERSEAIQRTIRDAGYRATPATHSTAKPQSSLWRHPMLLPTVLATGLWALAFVLGMLGGPTILANSLYGLAIVVGGGRIARSGYFALVRGRTLGIEFLMTIAVVGAALIGEWSEGAAVVVLFSLGSALEGLTMDRARGAIRALMQLAPPEANIRSRDGGLREERVPVAALLPGDIVLVRPGELAPADGRVSSGSTTINQAAITGESLPVAKEVGDEVYAGTTNERGYVEVEVTRRAQDTTLARIITLVEEAQGTRAPSQRFVDRFAMYYTPMVIAGAILVATVPPLLGAPLLAWVYKALVLLVIACPCALVISTPVSIVAAIGRGSHNGLLIKGGAYLEAMARVRAIAFDKTGTLTEGKPVVTDIIPIGARSAAELLCLAASVESRSEHPLAGAILQAAREQALSWPEPRNFEALPGRGARAVVDGRAVSVGSPSEFQAVERSVVEQLAALQGSGKTALLVAQDGDLLGVIAVADKIRPGVADVLAGLRDAGLRRIVMLTGDNERTASVVAGRLGISEVRAGLLPEDKTTAIKQLIADHDAVAMVGDGVNDAPALAAATVGIAMGGAGSDTALETADITLMADDLEKLPYLIRLSRAALQTIRVNIGFSLAVKALFLLLTLAGASNLWLAILADTGAALLVVANGMRLLRFR